MSYTDCSEDVFDFAAVCRLGVLATKHMVHGCPQAHSIMYSLSKRDKATHSKESVSCMCVCEGGRGRGGWTVVPFIKLEVKRKSDFFSLCDAVESIDSKVKFTRHKEMAYLQQKHHLLKQYQQSAVSAYNIKHFQFSTL